MNKFCFVISPLHEHSLHKLILCWYLPISKNKFCHLPLPGTSFILSSSLRRNMCSFVISPPQEHVFFFVISPLHEQVLLCYSPSAWTCFFLLPPYCRNRFCFVIFPLHYFFFVYSPLPWYVLSCRHPSAGTHLDLSPLRMEIFFVFSPPERNIFCHLSLWTCFVIYFPLEHVLFFIRGKQLCGIY